jgi:ribA/ribD-fused uncharacterized protein
MKWNGQELTPDNSITNFHAPAWEFLSNFYPSVLVLSDIDTPFSAYYTLEHAYQASKFNDQAIRNAIRTCRTPGKAKTMARTLRAQWRLDWHDVKVGVMFDLLEQKFKDDAMAIKLGATRPRILVEGNTWNDRFWGCVEVNGQWVGENMLGRLLMDVRDRTGFAEKAPVACAYCGQQCGGACAEIGL